MRDTMSWVKKEKQKPKTNVESRTDRSTPYDIIWYVRQQIGKSHTDLPTRPEYENKIYELCQLVYKGTDATMIERAVVVEIYADALAAYSFIDGSAYKKLDDIKSKYMKATTMHQKIGAIRKGIKECYKLERNIPDTFDYDLKISAYINGFQTFFYGELEEIFDNAYVVKNTSDLKYHYISPTRVLIERNNSHCVVDLDEALMFKAEDDGIVIRTKHGRTYHISEDLYDDDANRVHF